MNKYVKREDACSMFNRYFHNLEGNEAQTLVCDMKQAFLELPAFDVVPKEEVATAIFEEINEALTNLEYHIQSPRKTIKIEELKAQVDWILHEVVPKTLAELKKKYEEPKV